MASFVHRTCNQSSRVYPLYSLANIHLTALCLSDKKGFLFALKQKKPSAFGYIRIVVRLMVEPDLGGVDKAFRLSFENFSTWQITAGWAQASSFGERPSLLVVCKGCFGCLAYR